MSRLLILGGTGHPGRLIARHLLAHSSAEITMGVAGSTRIQAAAVPHR